MALFKLFYLCYLKKYGDKKDSPVGISLLRTLVKLALQKKNSCYASVFFNKETQIM